MARIDYGPAAPPEAPEVAPLEGPTMPVELPSGPATNGTAPHPAADPIETMVLLVDKCLSRTPRDERLKRVLAQWLATRHPQYPAATWLAQWGLV